MAWGLQKLGIILEKKVLEPAKHASNKSYSFSLNIELKFIFRLIKMIFDIKK